MLRPTACIRRAQPLPCQRRNRPGGWRHGAARCRRRQTGGDSSCQEQGAGV